MQTDDYIHLWEHVFSSLGYETDDGNLIHNGVTMSLGVFWPGNDKDDYEFLELLLNKRFYKIVDCSCHDTGSNSRVILTWHDNTTTTGDGDGLDVAMAQAVKLKVVDDPICLC